MDHSSDRHYPGRLPAQPSGYREVVVPAPRPSFGERLETDVELHVCPECRSELVYPLEWAPVDMRRWRVERRCPECEWHSVGLYEQAALDRFDDVLDAGVDAMVAELRHLQRLNMEADLEKLNLALSQDGILPEDF